MYTQKADKRRYLNKYGGSASRTNCSARGGSPPLIARRLITSQSAMVAACGGLFYQFKSTWRRGRRIIQAAGLSEIIMSSHAFLAVPLLRLSPLFLLGLSGAPSSHPARLIPLSFCGSSEESPEVVSALLVAYSHLHVHADRTFDLSLSLARQKGETEGEEARSLRGSACARARH